MYYLATQQSECMQVAISLFAVTLFHFNTNCSDVIDGEFYESAPHVATKRPPPPIPIPPPVRPPPTPTKPSQQAAPTSSGSLMKPGAPGSEDLTGSTSALMGLKVLVEIFLTCLVLLCTVFSKLSFVGITDDLAEVGRLVRNGSGSDPDIVARGVSLYWQLLVVLLVPNCVTFLRCTLFGLVGKSSQSFPFPNQRAFLAVSHFVHNTVP